MGTAKSLTGAPNIVDKRGGTRSWRNNNPGNIEYGPFARAHGAIGTDGRFAIFPDEATGTAAQAALLDTPSYNSMTLAKAINTYAPPGENDTRAYIASVAARLGLDPNTPMSQIDKNAMSVAMRSVENWREAPLINRVGVALVKAGAIQPKWKRG